MMAWHNSLRQLQHRGTPFYEKFKFAARKKRREWKYYVKFAIFRPAQPLPVREKSRTTLREL
jgi:hypothetical protein